MKSRNKKKLVLPEGIIAIYIGTNHNINVVCLLLENEVGVLYNFPYKGELKDFAKYSPASPWFEIGHQIL